MFLSRSTFFVLAGAVGWSPATSGQRLAALSATELAQNPVANLSSVPFRNNAIFRVGPRDRDQDMLNVQPVISFHPSKDLSHGNFLLPAVIDYDFSGSFCPSSAPIITADGKGDNDERWVVATGRGAAAKLEAGTSTRRIRAHELSG